MRRSLAIIVLSVCATIALACGNGDTISGPSRAPTQTIIGFSGLSDPACPGMGPLAPTSPHCAVRSYIESGFRVAAVSGDWVVRNSYGSPAPFIQFVASPGATATAEILVTNGNGPFSFASVDLYASTIPIPYRITGLRNSATVFTLSDTVPNTFGRFMTVTNQNSSAAIDELSIVLTNAAAACCGNPTGLDNLAVSR
jgi:hypothetical protein